MFKSQKGFSLVWIIIIIVLLLLIGGLIYYFTVFKPIFTTPAQVEYQNPFSKTEVYQNPFTDYQNPFEDLQ